MGLHYRVFCAAPFLLLVNNYYQLSFLDYSFVWISEKYILFDSLKNNN